MDLDLKICRIRSFHPHDIHSIARHANNRKIWINVRDHFPHPYRLQNAIEWFERIQENFPEKNFIIDVEGEAVGGIGFEIKEDIYRCTAEMGYWLGEEYWGKGIMTATVRAFNAWIFENFEVQRIQAEVFEWNPASMRVLEKAGFQLEGIHRKAAIKDHKVIDLYMYAKTRDMHDI